jgi:membrane dipeptidase
MAQDIGGTPTSSKTRRDTLKILGGGAIAAIGTATVCQPSTALAQAAASKAAATATARVVMDGHVHITSRVYWEGIDPWKPQTTGWDYARAQAAGINCVIECLGTYGFWNYNQAPKHMLRLIETFHRVAEANKNKMGIALSAADARRVIASGRMAVFLGVESGWDHDGDIDVLRALYRLGLRHIQFSSQSPFNALADVGIGTDKHWNGLSERGRRMIKEANHRGILIDIVHASEAAQAAIIAASEAPVVDSHDPLKAVTRGRGLSDDLLKAMAAKGGMIGIHGGAAAVGKRYNKWMLDNGEKYRQLAKPVTDVTGYAPSFQRPAGDYGDWAARMDGEARDRHIAAFAPWRDDAEAETLVPPADEWAEHVAHVIRTVGPDHVGIGLDMVGGRSGVPRDPTGYPDLFAAINRITTPENAGKIIGENWLRVIEKVMG